MIEMIAFDADDTLWHNEIRYMEAKRRFTELLSRYDSRAQVARDLDETEIENVKWYGYGVKSFTLSMIETAIRITGGQITGQEMEHVLALGREMLSHAPELFEHVQDTLTDLSRAYDLMLITKGDLLEQGRKVEQSGLARHFRHVEIVAEKTAAGYGQLLERHRIPADRFLMVGNSLRSDILPVLEIGGHAVHIPAPLTWAFEMAVDVPTSGNGYFELEHIGQLPALIAKLDGA